MPLWLILLAVGIVVAVVLLGGTGTGLLGVGSVVLLLGLAGIALGRSRTRI